MQLCSSCLFLSSSKSSPDEPLRVCITYCAALVLIPSGGSLSSGRKGFGQELKEKATPQSEKSTVDKIKETFTGGADKAAREVWPFE